MNQIILTFLVFQASSSISVFQYFPRSYVFYITRSVSRKKKKKAENIYRKKKPLFFFHDFYLVFSSCFIFAMHKISLGECFQKHIYGLEQTTLVFKFQRTVCLSHFLGPQCALNHFNITTSKHFFLMIFLSSP